MKHTDFRLGQEFLGPAGLKWRCTDIGSRTVAAIKLVHEDPIWYQGPPYIVREMVLDEKDMEECYPDIVALIVDRLRQSQASIYPKQNPDDFFTLLNEENTATRGSYPNRRFLRFDRVRCDGEILHPYSAKRANNGEWVLQIFLIFPCTYIEMLEADFVLLPIVTEDALKARAGLSRHPSIPRRQ